MKRLLHCLFHIGLGIIPRPTSAPRPFVSCWYGGLGMKPGSIRKRPCINRYIIMFQIIFCYLFRRCKIVDKQWQFIYLFSDTCLFIIVIVYYLNVLSSIVDIRHLCVLTSSIFGSNQTSKLFTFGYGNDAVDFTRLSPSALNYWITFFSKIYKS